MPERGSSALRLSCACKYLGGGKRGAAANGSAKEEGPGRIDGSGSQWQRRDWKAVPANGSDGEDRQGRIDGSDGQ